MSKSSNQKIKLVKLLEILKKFSDEEHPLSTAQLIEKLAEQGIQAERKAIYDDIRILNDAGYEIFSYRNRSNYYYIIDRGFDLAELRVLLDAVQAAKFITEKKTAILTEKIACIAGENRAKLLTCNINCFNTVKHTNENILYNIDTLDECILKKKKVSFVYFDYDSKCGRVYRKKGEKYIVNPIALVFSEDNYYLTCYKDKYKNISNYRVDRMDKVTMLETSIEPAECLQTFHIHTCKKQAFSMFVGELTEVEFIIDKSKINLVVDKFGESVKMTDTGEPYVTVKTQVQISPPFFAWCITFGTALKIVSPYVVVEKMRALLECLFAHYSKK